MTCIYKWKYLNCNSKWIYENAWNSLKNQGKMSIFMEWKWDEKMIYKYKWWWKMTYIYDWEFIENGWWKIIYKYDWILKMTYENKWEWKANYKYKWDNFLDYDMKNHDIHENKNVCPEFNGEKMHEHSVFLKTSFFRAMTLQSPIVRFLGRFWRQKAPFYLHLRPFVL